MKFWKTTMIFVFTLNLLLLIACSPFPSPSTPTPSDPCSSATIVSPEGAENRPDAKLYKVSSEIEISWQPSGCVMVVQSYQNERLKYDHKGVEPGTKLKIGEPDSGETEIKIWRDGFDKPSDSIWVWIE